MPATQPTNFVEKLNAAMKRDPKKAFVLAVLFAVLLGMWGKMMLSGGKGGPKTASAMQAARSTPRLSTTPNNKAKSLDATSQLQDWIAQPLPDGMSRNIFQLNLDYFPMDGTRAMQVTRTSNDPTFWEKLAKSIDQQADQQHKREILIQNLRQQAGQLQLTSTVMGSKPRAMVNGAMVGEGEVVAQFRIVKIDARSVTVEREGIKLEITMK
jgi:hypothetical protein